VAFVSGCQAPAYVTYPDKHQSQQFLSPQKGIIKDKPHYYLGHGDNADYTEEKDRNPVNTLFDTFFDFAKSCRHNFSPVLKIYNNNRETALPMPLPD
jgi:hypothetical protein